jgi:hypothetical protein
MTGIGTLLEFVDSYTYEYSHARLCGKIIYGQHENSKTVGLFVTATGNRGAEI